MKLSDSILLLFLYLIHSSNCTQKCDPEKAKAASSCYSNIIVTFSTFHTIQIKHEDYDAADHINLNKICDIAKKCADINFDCGKINEKNVKRVGKSCDYINYITGAFYPCMRNLRYKKDQNCVANFFSGSDNCEEWKENRACLKWTIRKECGRKFWDQYKPYWQKRTDLICGEI